MNLPGGTDRVLPDEVLLVQAAAARVRRRAKKVVGAEVSARVEALTAATVIEVQTAADEQLAWGTTGRPGGSSSVHWRTSRRWKPSAGPC